MKRAGFTLIEVLLVVAIIAVLIGIILPAVQAVRASADRAKSANHMKQIILAVHQFALENKDRVPSRMGWKLDSSHKADTLNFFIALAPYLHISLETAPMELYPPIARVPQYIDPADITIHYSFDKEVSRYPNCSYAFNVVGTTGECTLNSFYGDGTSNTIAFTTHYMLCGVGKRQHGFDWTLGASPEGYNERRATFADEWYLDVVPVTRATERGNVTMPSRAGATFQVKPKLEDCDPYIPQGLHYGGLHSAMFDGSVKFWRSGVRPQVFWAAVTPNGNETDFD
jgi:prepilin-type N-terminal cleavage/methylation domain-containing protein